MKAVLFYGVRLPIQQYDEVTGEVADNYTYVFGENFPGSGWEFHVRQLRGRYSAYLCLARLNVSLHSAEPFRLVNPKGLQEQKMKPPERDELKDILQALGVAYTPPKWFLTASR
ncbi:MAG: hypothetical protein DRP83_00765 [Planctomycetota bacterium]|nr:MAG: hypothetical protein DRP83_00765 [Planctomycetota bacterium]